MCICTECYVIFAKQNKQRRFTLAYALKSNLSLLVAYVCYREIRV